MEYSVIQVVGRAHVLKPIMRDGHYIFTKADPDHPDDTTKWTYHREIIPQPDYRGTGMALCGVLKKSETLHMWETKHGKK